jgi:spore coat protein U-like protein
VSAVDGWRTAMLTRLAVLTCAFLFFAFLPAPASAQQCTGTGSTGPVVFGEIATGDNTRRIATGTIAVDCTGSANQEIEICPYIGGGSSPGSTGPRYMVSGTNRMAFDIYTNSGLTARFANGVQVGANRGYRLTLSSGGTGSLAISVYGQIPAGQQALAPGNYTADMQSGSQISYRARASSTSSTVDCTSVGTTNTDSYRFNATATNLATCTLATSPVQFGSVESLVSIRDAAGAITVNCSVGAPYSIAISGGANGGTSGTTRKMASGTSSITYGLYSDSARSVVWYNDTGSLQSGTATGSAQVYPVYGRVPAQTTPPPGSYADTVVVTLSY